MKKLSCWAKLLILALTVCLSVCVLVGCQNTDGNDNNDDKNNVEQRPTEFEVELRKGSELGELKATAIKKEGDGILYEIEIEPKMGYVVENVNINGAEIEFDNGKLSCVLEEDAKVDVTYARKSNEELENRRETVLKKMQQITGTLFKYEDSYQYNITSSKPVTLNKGTLYQGMPYSNHPTLSYDAFMQDFVYETPDENGVYTVKNIWGSTKDKSIFGNNCADTVYFSWSTVSTSISCQVSLEFNENYGLVPVGAFSVEKNNFDDKKRFIDTEVICKANGEQTIYEAYALYSKGDCAVTYSSYGNHVILISEVHVERTKDGKIDGENSYVMFYDQNAGYTSKKGVNNKTVRSSCSYNAKMKFNTLYTCWYLPYTCNELMDESYAVESPIVTDSLAGSTFGVDTITKGEITSNYYFSKAKMELTAADGTTYVYNRYRDETDPKIMKLSWFASKSYAQYQFNPVYADKLTMDTLPAGNYKCKVTVYLANGYEQVVRDFEFTK